MERQAFIDLVMEKAKQQGIGQWELYSSQGESFKVNIYQGEVEDYKVNTSLGVSLRVLEGGRVGYAYTEALDEEAADFLLENARQNARVVESDDPQQIFPGSPKYEQVDTYSPKLAELTPQWKIDAAMRMEKAAWAASDKVKTVSACTLQSVEYDVMIVNCAGLHLTHRGNALYAYVEAAVQDGEVVQTALGYSCYTGAEAFDFEGIASRAVQLALDKCAAVKIPSGSRMVAIENEAFCDILETFAGIFSAENTQKGMSQLSGKEGQTIASAVFSLIDDPLMAAGLQSRPFDDEGVATYTKAVVESGVLKTLLHNLKTAAKQGVTTTGNASKAGAAAPIVVSPSNFYVQPGEYSQAELLKQMGHGLLVTEVQGLHAGANMVSGDFSLAARGFLVENGQRGAAVEEITVAGNFYELLRDIVAVSSDLKFSMPSQSYVGAPTVLVKKLAVSGE